LKNEGWQPSRPGAFRIPMEKRDFLVYSREKSLSIVDISSSLIEGKV